LWLRERRPTGIGKIGLFDRSFDEIWRAILESSGLAELIHFELQKGENT